MPGTMRPGVPAVAAPAMLAAVGAPNRAAPRQCRDCLAWIVAATARCAPCKRFAWRHAANRCRTCRRTVPLRTDRHCRMCAVMSQHSDEEIAGQLWLGAIGAGSRLAHRRRREQEQGQLSAQLQCPGQDELFSISRDWTSVDLDQLPALTPASAEILAVLEHLARAHGWSDRNRRDGLRLLRLLTAWLGVAAPIRHTDVIAAARQLDCRSPDRVVQFLASHDLLRDDRPLQADPYEVTARRLQAAMPAVFGPDVAVWVDALRATHRRGQPRAWAAVQVYLNHALPVLKDWATRFESLASITRDDVDAALAARGPKSAHVLRTALRSLFQALRHHRRIFADPTRNLHGKTAHRLARPIPSDRLRGLLDRVTTATGRAAVALVAIHALSIEELRALHLTDLDRSRWRLAVARDQGTHYVILDDTCIRMLSDWLYERGTRWPATTNPHLFVTRMTATDPRDPPPSRYAIVRHFQPTGLRPAQLRTDRILYEAAQGVDPVLIMRLFGVCKTTAMKYVNTAALTRSRDPIAP